MEEKKYPTVEEESFGGMVSEPIIAPVPDTIPVDGMTEVHDWKEMDRRLYERFPWLR